MVQWYLIETLITSSSSHVSSPYHHSCIIIMIHHHPPCMHACIIITIIPFIMHHYVGDVSEALHYFSKALQCDSKVPFVQVYTHRGLMLYSAGSPSGALKDYTTAINALYGIVRQSPSSSVSSIGGSSSEEARNRRNDLVQNLVRAAMCYQCMGQFNKTVGRWVGR